METGNRFERDPRSGTQQSQQGYRDDTTGVPGEWNNPVSSLGQGEEQLGKFMCTARCFLFVSLHAHGTMLIMFF